MRTALETLAGLDFQTIRICNYWDRTQRQPEPNFDEVDWQLDAVQRFGKQAILTVGLKTPRYPEWYYPRWVVEKFPRVWESADPVAENPGLDEYVLAYIAQVVEHTRQHPALSHYQVGNESLNPIGFGSTLKHLSYDFVHREVELVRGLKRSDQQILLTNSVGGPDASNVFEDTLELQPDAVGVNAYYRAAYMPAADDPTRTIYSNVAEANWANEIARWQQQLAARQIAAVAAEIQAEPWELDSHVLAQPEFPSATPAESVALAVKLGEAGYTGRLFWGAEYWVAHHWKYGGMQWLKPMAEFATENLPGRRPS